MLPIESHISVQWAILLQTGSPNIGNLTEIVFVTWFICHFGSMTAKQYKVIHHMGLCMTSMWPIEGHINVQWPILFQAGSPNYPEINKICFLALHWAMLVYMALKLWSYPHYCPFIGPLQGSIYGPKKVMQCPMTNATLVFLSLTDC